MHKYTFLILSIGAGLFLTACVSEEQVNAKLQTGCVSAINALIEPAKVQEVITNQFETILEVNGLHRRVSLDLLQADGWAEDEKKYHCLFNENWGFAKTSHTANLVEVDIRSERLGLKADQESRNGLTFKEIANETHDAMMKASK